MNGSGGGDPDFLGDPNADIEITVGSPDSTTIEIVATPIGATGTAVNVKSAYTTDGSPPSLPTTEGSGYTLGSEIRYQVRAPFHIAVEGVPVRPYDLVALVRATNAENADNFHDRKLTIHFSSSVDHVSGITPAIIIQKTKTLLIPTSGPTITSESGRTVSTVTYDATFSVNDPLTFQVVARIEGPVGSVGDAQIWVRTATSPAAPPTLPSYSSPDGDLQVGKSVQVLSPIRGVDFRDELASRTFQAKVRAVDANNTDTVFVAVINLTIVASDTVTALDVLVRHNRDILALTDLPVVSGAYELAASDADNIEVLLRARGVPGTRVLTRGRYTNSDESAPVLASIQDVVDFDSAGTPVFSNAEGFLGTYAIDQRAGLVALQNAGLFRLVTGGLIHVDADVTSAVNIANTFRTSFDFRVKPPQTLATPYLTYVNSRNPDDVLPLVAGTDINGTITGSGTFADPFVLGVDSPEQLQVFVVPDQTTATSLAWVQTGYAFNNDPIDVLYPITPELWKRAFTRDQKVDILPHPTIPGTPSLKPPRGDELIVMSGGVLAADPGTDPGFSRRIQLYARAQSTQNAEDFRELTVWLIVADPAVL